MVMRETPPANPELDALIAKARDHVMSPAEILAQKRSWVIGQMGLSRPDMSREEIEALVDRSLGQAPSTATDREAAEAAFLAFWQSPADAWARLSPSEQSAWVRAAKAAREA